MKAIHQPVLLREVLDYLNVEKLAHSKGRGRIIDATFGFGGHSLEFIKRGIEVLGIELDEEVLEIARKRIEKAFFDKHQEVKTCPIPEDKLRESYILVCGNFKDIDEIAKRYGFNEVDAILFDLGVTTGQLISPTRGFSFSNPSAPLDMRIDKKGQGVTAADLLNSLDERNLVKLFSAVLSRGQSIILARKVIRMRSQRKFEKVSDFLEVVGWEKTGRLHPATKAFLALRIAVNSELENLREALPKAFGLLKIGGRMAVISFHSGEERLVKRFFKDLEIQKCGLTLSKKPIVPSESEIRLNPKSRSAKMRVIEKIC